VENALVDGQCVRAVVKGSVVMGSDWNLTQDRYVKKLQVSTTEMYFTSFGCFSVEPEKMGTMRSHCFGGWHVI